jgi:hypothetical protein
MKNFWYVLGASLSLVLPLTADVFDTHTHEYPYWNRNRDNNNFVSEDGAKLYAWTLGDGSTNTDLVASASLDTDYTRGYDFYVPFDSHSVTRNISRIDEATFLIAHKGVYQITFTVAQVSGTGTIYAIEAVDSYGSQQVPGSQMAFRCMDNGVNPFQTLSVLAWVEEDYTLIRIAEVTNTSGIQLNGEYQDAVLSALTIVQLSQ